MQHLPAEEVVRLARIFHGMGLAPGLTTTDHAILAAWKRQCLTRLEELASTTVDAIDLLSGDPDLEDGTGLEDELPSNVIQLFPVGAGCPVSDPGGCEHDGREEDRS